MVISSFYLPLTISAVKPSAGWSQGQNLSSWPTLADFDILSGHSTLTHHHGRNGVRLFTWQPTQFLIRPRLLPLNTCISLAFWLSHSLVSRFAPRKPWSDIVF